MESIVQLNHPVIKEKLSVLRSKDTSRANFRVTMKELGKLISYEVLRDFITGTQEVQTPLSGAEGEFIKDLPVIVSVLRAGNILMEGALELIPNARCGHLGIYRDKFINNTVEYYFRLPEHTDNKPIFVMDPMIATGKTATASISRLKQCGVGKIYFICLLISDEAAKFLAKNYPEVQIYCAGIESGLDKNGLIIPGIGDVGGRLYGPN
jgi:uracil phosphoribosyltransferase